MASAGDLTGELIADKYELLSLLGRGGMGAVYEARNVTTLRRCAVKVLLTPELSGDGEVVKRFFREAKASGLIESEHVVAAFDSGIDSAARVYYVMECLQGEDLEQTLSRLGQVSVRTAMKIIWQAATGLASAHALGVVHRDVKPANLFLAVGPNDEVKVKILDFGVAKVKMEVFNESITSLTHGGTLLGTPLYMSPEQLRRASSIDESADVWSLGVVLFECLTGQSPWGSCDGIGELVTAILTLPIPPLQDLAPWVKPDLAEIALRSLAREPAQRLRDGGQLREALSKLLGGDTRLFLHEITVPDEQERRSRAARLSTADTVLMQGVSPHSAAPVVTTTAPSPPSRRIPSLSLALVGALLVGTTAWGLAQRFGNDLPTGPAPVAALAFPTVPASATVAVNAIVARTPPSPANEAFELEVGPVGAQVIVNGAPVPIRDGKVEIHGPVGSVHTAQVMLNGRQRTERVVVTTLGVLPARVVLEEARNPSPAKPRPSPGSAASPAGTATLPQATPVDLDTVFE